MAFFADGELGDGAMSVQFSPGPWIYATVECKSERIADRIYDQDGQVVVDDVHREDDARLISAATELLEAAQQALTFACLTLAFIGRDQGTERIERTLADLCAEARLVEATTRAAITKAGAA